MRIPDSYRALIDRSASAKYLPVAGSRDLVVVFSETHHGFRNPTTYSCAINVRQASFNRLLLRDMQGLWYYRGLDGICDALIGAADFVRDFAVASGFERVSIIGVSSGSHAAFVTGTRLCVDAVICIGCRFDLSPQQRQGAGRSAGITGQRLRALWSEPDIELPYLNAREAAEAPGAHRSPVRLYFDPEVKQDQRHAGYLKDLACVTPVHLPGVGHDVNRLLEEVFRADPLLGGKARYINPMAKIEAFKLAAGSKLAAAVQGLRRPEE